MRPIFILITMICLAASACTEGSSQGTQPGDLTLELVGRTTEGVHLTAATSTAISRGGQIFVADWFGPNITVLRPDGSLTAVVGQSGAGPGEFHAIRNIRTTLGDSLVAWDPLLRRVTVFNLPELQVTAVSRLDAGHAQIEGKLAPVFEVFPSGSSDRPFISVLRQPAVGTTLSALEGRKDALVRLNENGAVEEVLRVFSSPPVLGAETGGQLHMTPDPIAGRTHVAVGPAGRVFMADGGAGTVKRLRPDGTWQLIASFHGASSISSAEKQLIAEGIEDVLRPALLQHSAEDWPIIWDLVVDASGNAWVQTDGRPGLPEQWSVLDSVGDQLGRVTLPPNNHLLATAYGWLVTAEIDAFDVPTILIFEVRGL